jgi:hypothetical protein
MRHAHFALLIGILVIAGTGCTRGVNYLGAERYPAKPSTFAVDVFYGHQPARGNIELATLDLAQDEWKEKGTALLPRLMDKVREVGGDALYLEGVASPDATDITRVTGYVLHWTEDSPASQSVSAPITATPVPSVPSAAEGGDTISFTADPSLNTWSMAVNSQPMGAIVYRYDEHQRRVRLGLTPLALSWPHVADSDILTLAYQGRRIEVVPQRNRAVFVDFSSQQPKIEGADLSTTGGTIGGAGDSDHDGGGTDCRSFSDLARVAAAATNPLSIWTLAINTKPQGAAVARYDSQQQRQQIGNTPLATAWPHITDADVVVVMYQGRRVELFPNRNQAVLVDFTQAQPVITGGTSVTADQGK